MSNISDKSATEYTEFFDTISEAYDEATEVVGKLCRDGPWSDVALKILRSSLKLPSGDGRQKSLAVIRALVPISLSLQALYAHIFVI